jgi:phosphinothricin acetyltransferase
MPSGNVKIRHATSSDLGALTALYNHYVESTAITFDLAPFTEEARGSWLDQFKPTGRYQLFVAENDETIAGYACSQRFRVKRAYETSVETSIYLAPGEQGKGLGSSLYRTLFESIGNADLHRAYAGVTHPNEASIAFHKKFGFRSIGVYKEVGRKMGRYWDVEWFEKIMS